MRRCRVERVRVGLFCKIREVVVGKLFWEGLVDNKECIVRGCGY